MLTYDTGKLNAGIISLGQGVGLVYVILTYRGTF